MNKLIAELRRAKRASGAPWVRNFGNLLMQEILVMTFLPIKCLVSNIVFFLVSGVNCEFHRWILKRIFNY